MGGPGKKGGKAVRVALRDRNSNALLVVHHQRGRHVVDGDVLVHTLLRGGVGQCTEKCLGTGPQATEDGDGIGSGKSDVAADEFRVVCQRRLEVVDVGRCLTEPNVQHHHHQETTDEAQGGKIGVFVALRFRNDLETSDFMAYFLY